MVKNLTEQSIALFSVEHLLSHEFASLGFCKRFSNVGSLRSAHHVGILWRNKPVRAIAVLELFFSRVHISWPNFCLKRGSFFQCWGPWLGSTNFPLWIFWSFIIMNMTPRNLSLHVMALWHILYLVLIVCWSAWQVCRSAISHMFLFFNYKQWSSFFRNKTILHHPLFN